MYAEVTEGINYIWNNNFEEAERLFATKKDTNPRFALHYAEAAFLRSFITADTEDTEQALRRLGAAENLAEEHVKYYEKGNVPPGLAAMNKNEVANRLLDAKVVLGDVLYLFAVLQLTRDNKLKGAYNMRKSWKVFEESLKAVKNAKDPSIYEDELVRCMNFGAGFFFFAMGIIPPKFLKLVEFVGFKADRDLGLRYVRETYDAGGVRAPFATMVLLFNNLLLPRGLANPAKYLREADALVRESIQKYPSGSLFHVMGSHCARKQCNIEEGIRYMETALANCANLNRAPLIYQYELANCYAMRMDWAAASRQFEPLVNEAKFQVRALCAAQFAACLILMGETERAKQVFGRIPSYVNKSSTVDPIIVRQAARWSANGGWFAAFELLYIRRDLVKMEPFVPRCLELLDQVSQNTQAHRPILVDPANTKSKFSFPKSFSNMSLGSKKEPLEGAANDRAAYLLLRGSLLKSVGRTPEAKEAFEEVIRFQSLITEKYYIPYCLYELAETLYHEGNLQGAQESIKKCNEFSGYDWEDPLKVRLRVTQDQLKKGGVPTEDPDEVPVPADAAAQQEDPAALMNGVAAVSHHQHHDQDASEAASSSSSPAAAAAAADGANTVPVESSSGENPAPPAAGDAVAAQ